MRISKLFPRFICFAGIGTVLFFAQPARAQWAKRVARSWLNPMSLIFCPPPENPLLTPRNGLDEVVMNGIQRALEDFSASHTPEFWHHRSSKDDPCLRLRQLTAAARTAEIPPALLYAVAWTESGWEHYNAIGMVHYHPNHDRSTDWGILQINDRAHRNERFSPRPKNWKPGDPDPNPFPFEVDFPRAIRNPEVNIAFGSIWIRYCYRKALKHYPDRDPQSALIFRAAYACYNGGVGAMESRVGRFDGPKEQVEPHDRRFADFLGNKPHDWEKLVQEARCRSSE